MKKRNIIKAIIYVIVGTVLTFVSGLFALLMYFSNTFLPVYVGSTYVVGNQLLRYLLYVVLGVIFVASIALIEYAIKYLSKKVKRR